MRDRIKNKYITASVILLISSVIVKIISAFYKIPLTAYIGAQGRGYFTIAYNICLPIHALTMGAFPIALTKLVSTYDAKGDKDKTFALKSASDKLFFIIGAAGTVVMFALAKPYASLISSSPKSVYTILALAPSIFFSCLCACKRAYAEGFLDMKLTAASQLIEALAKMIFGLVFARLSLSYFYSYYIETSTVAGIIVYDEKEALAQIYPLTSAFAMFGATVGSILAYLFSVIYDRINYKSVRVSRVQAKEAYNELMAFSVSLVGATVIQSLAAFADTSSIQYCLTLCSEKALRTQYNYNGSDVYTYVLGIYASALDFKNLIPSIVMSLGVTAVPALSSAYENESDSFSSLVTSILKYSVIISSLGALVLILFNKEILDILFAKTNPDIALNAPRLLYWFGLTVLPSSIATTVVYSVQSLGFAKKSIPSFIAGALVRVFINFILISNNKINVIGSAVSGFFGFLLIVVWNLVIIKRHTNAKINFIQAFIKPIICALITYFAMDYIRLNNILIENKYINLVIMGITCLILYISLLIFSKCLSIREIFIKKKV